MTAGNYGFRYINGYYTLKYYNADKTCTNKHIYAGKERVCTVVDNEPAYIHRDHLNSGGVVSTNGGGVGDRVAFAPYGEVLYQQNTNASAGSVTGIDEKFTGQLLDPETGLYYFNARYYDPKVGVFISADTMVPQMYFSQSLNRYQYCNGNPVIYNDPTGHFAEWIILGSALLGGIGAASDGFTQWDMSKWQMDDFVRGFAIGGMGSILSAYIGAPLIGKVFGWQELFGISWNTIGAVVGGIHSCMAGSFDIYSHDTQGAKAFLSDHTWGFSSTILGTFLGLTQWVGEGDLAKHESKQSNHFIFYNGWSLHSLFGGTGATTWGSVIAFNRHRHDYRHLDALLEHEKIHTRQGREWGPYFIPAFVVGEVYGYSEQSAYAISTGSTKNFGSRGHARNPFEKQAFKKNYIYHDWMIKENYFTWGIHFWYNYCPFN